MVFSKKTDKYLKTQMNKIKLTTIFILLFTIDCYSNNNGNDSIKNTAISSGIGMGTVLAVVVSWERNKSILLAFLHGIFSWLYVIYFALTRKAEERK
jgi:ABC-type Fe3+-siderophore transport system permease subunit